jgi:hypothetical protein
MVDVVFQVLEVVSFISGELDFGPVLLSGGRVFPSFDGEAESSGSVSVNDRTGELSVRRDIGVRFVANIAMALVRSNVDTEVFVVFNGVHAVSAGLEEEVVEVVGAEVMGFRFLDHRLFLTTLVVLFHNFRVEVEHHDLKTLIVLPGIVQRVGEEHTPVVLIVFRGFGRSKNLGLARNELLDVVHFRIEISVGLGLKIRADVILARERTRENSALGINRFGEVQKFREAQEELGGATSFDHDPVTGDKQGGFGEEVSLYRCTSRIT